jgi:hypothetical protein
MTTNPPTCVGSIAHWRSCGIAFSVDHATVIDFSPLGSVQKLDAASGKLLNELRLARKSPGPKRAVGNELWRTSGQLSPRASFFNFSDYDRGDMLLDVRGWKRLPSLGYGAWSPNERFFVVDEQLWDVARRVFVATLP